MTIVYMLTGAALFMGGFFIAWKLKPPQVVEVEKKDHALTDEEQEAIKKFQTQYANWMSYNGRAQT